MIQAKEIIKEYKDDGVVTQALRGVTLLIEKGEFVSIMWPSGSGKSTLLHILSFLDRPSRGIYRFNNHSAQDLSDAELAQIRNKEMGFVFQSFNLLGRASVFENVMLPLLYSDTPVHERKNKVEKAISAVELNDKTNVEAGKLSGGQKQRVAIARALVNEPNVIFADEPTGNLDSVSGAGIIEILRGLHQNGHTIVLVTHETYTAEAANRLIKIKDGKVESDTTVNNKRDFFK